MHRIAEGIVMQIITHQILILVPEIHVT